MLALRTITGVSSCEADLDTSTAAQDYVALYGGDAKLLLETLEHVQQAATRILDAIELDRQQEAA